MRSRSRRTLVPSLLALALGPGGAMAQANPSWERSRGPTEAGPTVFHATQGLNLPTAVTPGAGEFLFEIAHRFVPPVSTEGTFLGLDGPVQYRLGLAWGVTDALMVGIQRSNLDDNLDLGARFRFLEVNAPVPLQVAVAGGLAWNHEVGGLMGGSTQAHAALILNAGIGEWVALGVVPALVHNPSVREDGEDAAFSLGLQGRLGLTEMVALVGEWTVTEERTGLPHDPASLSLELETGGHFFRVGVTNSIRLNPSQHLAGAGERFESDQLRLAFNITRVLAF